MLKSLFEWNNLTVYDNAVDHIAGVLVERKDQQRVVIVDKSIFWNGVGAKAGENFPGVKWDQWR